jgi:hypothetical protein
MSIRELPQRPDLEHLKKQAKELLHKLEQREPEALSRAASVRVEFDPSAPNSATRSACWPSNMTSRAGRS